jgi:hypothetical protein
MTKKPRTRDPVARALRSPRFRPRTIADKRGRVKHRKPREE